MRLHRKFTDNASTFQVSFYSKNGRNKADNYRRRKSLLGRLKPNSTPKTKNKIVLMPRSECERFFATDENGSYIGTEDQRTWTEQELEDRYGKYKTALPSAPLKYERQEDNAGRGGLS